MSARRSSHESFWRHPQAESLLPRCAHGMHCRLLSFIDQMPSPAGPMSTSGGDIIRFVGSDLPVGGTLIVRYATLDNRLSFTATGCIVRSDNLAECRSVSSAAKHTVCTRSICKWLALLLLRVSAARTVATGARLWLRPSRVRDC